MNEKEDKVYIDRREIKFIGLIKTWGEQRIKGEYEIPYEAQTIHLHLTLVEEALSNKEFLDYVNMTEVKIRKPSRQECREGLIRNKEDLEKFFRSKNMKELVRNQLTTAASKAGGMEKIKIPGYKICSTYTTIEFKRIEKKKSNQRQNIVNKKGSW